MEPEGSCGKPPDQLQSAFVQNQPVQSQHPGASMTSLPDDDHAPSEEKVVIRFGSETIKGYIESPEWRSLEELFIAAAQGPSTSLRIRKVGETKSEDVAIGEAKAIFYVKEFDGNSHHKDLRFYKRVPIVNGIWVRVEFCDGEITEGIVHNTSRYVV